MSGRIVTIFCPSCGSPEEVEAKVTAQLRKAGGASQLEVRFEPVRVEHTCPDPSRDERPQIDMSRPNIQPMRGVPIHPPGL